MLSLFKVHVADNQDKFDTLEIVDELEEPYRKDFK
jgi:hypothetical protein